MLICWFVGLLVYFLPPSSELGSSTEREGFRKRERTIKRRKRRGKREEEEKEEEGEEGREEKYRFVFAFWPSRQQEDRIWGCRRLLLEASGSEA